MKTFFETGSYLMNVAAHVVSTGCMIDQPEQTCMITYNFCINH